MANIIYIDCTALGPYATDADAMKMAALLRAKGYDARFGTGSNRPCGDFDQEKYDADWQECMGLLG